MSHEIRTPMNAMLGYVQLLQRDQNLNEQQKGYLGTVHRSGLHLLSLINDVLDMAKIEAGKQEVNASENNLERIFLDVQRMFRLPAHEKGLDLDFMLHSSLPKVVITDGGKIRQVLINLLSNAVKFTDQGAVTVRAHGVPAEAGQTQIVVEVEDTGTGIPQSDLEHIFGTFNQSQVGKNALAPA